MIGANYIQVVLPALQTEISDVRIKNKRILDVLVENNGYDIVYTTPLANEVQHIASDGKLRITDQSDAARNVYVLIKN